MLDNNTKREIMMDHYSHPYNKGLKEDDRYLSVHNASDSCIDDLTVQMLIENNKVEDVNFDGVGCTIATSSTDIMCSLLENKSIHEAKNIINNYLNMVNELPYDEDLLDELLAFDTLYKQANRIKCGIIGINAMKEIIDNYEKR